MVVASSDTDFDRVLETVASKIGQRECILFLGSGVHRGPPPDQDVYAYPKTERPLTAKELSNELAEASGFSETFDESPDDLQRTSLWYESRRSRMELVQVVEAAVQRDRKPSAAMRALARLDFPVVVTTNYDQLFEAALRHQTVQKKPSVVVYDPKRAPTPTVSDPTVDEPLLFKIHGDIGKPESIVITDEDYIHFVLRMNDTPDNNPLPLEFHYFFKRWPTLFVGYSLMDYNLRLLFKTLRWKVDKARIPPTYSVDLKPDPLIFDVWHNQRRYVEFITQDVWNFVPQLYERVTGETMET